MKILFFILDQFISGLIIGPLTAAYWWGCWGLIDRHFTVFDRLTSVYIYSIIGNAGFIFLIITTSLWNKIFPLNQWLTWIFGVHIYTILKASFSVFQWIGVWKLLDECLEFTPENHIITYAIAQLSLWLLKSSKSAQAPPMAAANVQDFSYDFRLRFFTKPSCSLKYWYDILLTVVVIHQIVPVYWRGMWYILDCYFLPENKFNSMIYGFVVGYSLMIILTVLQPVFNSIYKCAYLSFERGYWSSRLKLINEQNSNFNNQEMIVIDEIRKIEDNPTMMTKCEIETNNNGQKTETSTDSKSENNISIGMLKNGRKLQLLSNRLKKYDELTRWLLEVILYFISNFVNVVIWRSVWLFCDIYLIPDNIDAGNLTAVIIGMGVLILAGSGLSLACSCDEEGNMNESIDEVCYTPNMYVRNFRCCEAKPTVQE